MSKTVTFKGKALTLVGRVLKPPLAAPDFRVVSQDLKEVTLADFKGKVKLISSFPSLDTPVCDLQVKEFNKKAGEFSGDVVIIGISKDLPFAQKRFCDAHDIDKEVILSDFKYSSFGINYGLLIKELNLLARSVQIIDKNGILRYSQIVPEITTPPSYDEALSKLKEIVKAPPLALPPDEVPSKCTPCEGGALPLPKATVEKMLARYRKWEVVEEKKLAKEFRFKDFVEAKYFLDLVSVIAEEQGHHPTMTIAYNKVKVTLTTHAAGGLTENDFIMAKIIDDTGGGE